MVTVVQIGGEVYLLPTPAVATALVPSPTMTFGAITLTPGVTAGAAGVPSSSIISILTLTPSPATALAALPGIGVVVGEVTLDLLPAIAQAAVPVPTLTVAGLHRITMSGSIDTTINLDGSVDTLIAVEGSV